MTYVEYNYADGTVDFAPESYLDQGAVTLMRIADIEYDTMFKAVNGGPRHNGSYGIDWRMLQPYSE